MGALNGEVMLEVGSMINGSEQRFQMSSSSTSMYCRITSEDMIYITQF